jgi:hypothetical protein
MDCDRSFFTSDDMRDVSSRASIMKRSNSAWTELRSAWFSDIFIMTARSFLELPADCDMRSR